MNRPYLLTPAAKDYLWGGSRLNDDFNLNMPISPFAEAWVYSTHPDGPSRVAELGCTLEELLKAHPAWLGEHARAVNGGQMPILIKLIDAKQNLSVQVHPDDAYAATHEKSLGKTEMWYVLDAKPGAELVYGFNQDVTARQVTRAVGDGRIDSLLNHVPVHKNDLFYIEAGTVHAIGAGCLIAEIQESSNITYLTGAYVRDKDAVGAAFMICEMFAFYKTRGVSLIQKLDALYAQYGYCLNTLHTYEFSGSAGMEKMQALMGRFHEGLDEIAGIRVARTEDYTVGLNGLPKSDVLKFCTDSGSVVIRPSGTEPKLKAYISVTADDAQQASNVETRIAQFLQDRIR